MKNTRLAKLRRNFRLMFWLQALLEVKVFNVISTLFYIYRGLTLSQIFYTAVVFSVVTLLSEVPSSYLADRWGRKNVIIVATITSVIYWIINIFAWSFPVFMLAIALYAFSHALMSGTDEALIYDTTHELGKKDHSLKRLGNYYSARHIFKIAAPLLAVLIAKNLTNDQYIMVLSIDVIATTIACVLSWLLIEPNHHLQLEKVEAGILKDAFKLLRNNYNLLRIMFSRSLIFIAMFMLWRVSSDYFTSIGLPLIFLGISASVYHLALFVLNGRIHLLFKNISVTSRINYLNYLNAILYLSFFLLSLVNGNPLILLILYSLALISEMIRWPLYSEVINKVSSSYNRATTISLTSFAMNILDVPLKFLAAYLITFGYPYLFALIATLYLIPSIFFRLREENEYNTQ